MLAAAEPAADLLPWWNPGVDHPIPADFDGDRRADPAVYRPASLEWLIDQTAVGPWGYTYGSPESVPVPADFRGDGEVDLAVYQRDDATWIIRGADGSVTTARFGDSYRLDRPIPADFKGDGKADLAVFRPAEARWLIQLSSGNLSDRTFGTDDGTEIPRPG